MIFVVYSICMMGLSLDYLILVFFFQKLAIFVILKNFRVVGLAQNRDTSGHRMYEICIFKIEFEGNIFLKLNILTFFFLNFT